MTLPTQPHRPWSPLPDPPGPAARAWAVARRHPRRTAALGTAFAAAVGVVALVVHLTTGSFVAPGSFTVCEGATAASGPDSSKCLVSYRAGARVSYTVSVAGSGWPAPVLLGIVPPEPGTAGLRLVSETQQHLVDGGYVQGDPGPVHPTRPGGDRPTVYRLTFELLAPCPLPPGGEETIVGFRVRYRVWGLPREQMLTLGDGVGLRGGTPAQGCPR